MRSAVALHDGETRPSAAVPSAMLLAAQMRERTRAINDVDRGTLLPDEARTQRERDRSGDDALLMARRDGAHSDAIEMREIAHMASMIARRNVFAPGEVTRGYVASSAVDAKHAPVDDVAPTYLMVDAVLMRGAVMVP